MPIDFLIIGQGLAGSLLAWTLLRRGCRVQVVGDGVDGASHVAAGLINPVTGMRMVKTPDIDFLLPAARRCYAQLAQVLGQNFYQEMPMLRVLRNPVERQVAQKRLAQPEYQAYLATLLPADTLANGVVAPFGALVQKQTGYLRTRPLLEALRGFFQRENSYCQAEFVSEELTLKPTLAWRGWRPKQIIFCQGYRALDTPWFGWLPFQPAKGEILTLRHAQPLPQTLLNFGHWLMPTAQHVSRVGATFSHDSLDTHPTAAAREQLLAALADVSPIWAQAEILAQDAHIRPCTLDKQPFVGYHPKHPQLAIFNGFGAKGSLQIPWYSAQFAEALLSGIPPPASIHRHFAAHFPG